MKKLKATDIIKVEHKLYGTVTLHRNSKLDIYVSEEKFGLLYKVPLFISLDQINEGINDGLCILIKGEYEEDEELKEEKREDGNKVSEVKNNIAENEKVEDKKVISGLDILNDIYNNGEESRYYNCKLIKYIKNNHGNTVKRNIINGIVYNTFNEELTQAHMLYFMNSEFTLVKEEKEVTWQEAIEILTNQSDKYEVYTGNDNVKTRITKKCILEIDKIVKNKWYVVEK